MFALNCVEIPLIPSQNLAHFVRAHEKALANALQLRKQRVKHGNTPSVDLDQSSTTNVSPSQASSQSATSAFITALSLGHLGPNSQTVKPAKLTLTPHHLFYLLSRFEGLQVDVGSMNVRIENIHTEQSPANYVSFLSQPPKSRGRSDRDSIHSIGSIRSVVSNITSFWSNIGVGESNSVKAEKTQAQLHNDTKYLYSAFTKIPCLRLAPDLKARLIDGFEEFPFDTAVPLLAFKNLSALEISDLDFRQFFGWDRLADQLRSLTVKRSNLDDPLDLIVHIVLDDMEKRRRRSSKPQSSPTPIWPASPSHRHHRESSRLSFASSTPETPRFGTSESPKHSMHVYANHEVHLVQPARNKSSSPTRPPGGRQGSSYRHAKTSGEVMRRSGSASSNSSSHSLVTTARSRSSTNLLSMGILPASKWRFLRHLSLSDNSMTSLAAHSLAPLANTLQSLDLSSNLLTEIPDCLATLTALRALNLANCMIESLHSLTRSPLPAITALNLRANRLNSLAGVQRLFSLERFDVRENRISDPTEMARLTGLPEIKEVYLLGNPLIRLHGHYRITIFNLFRGAPGYTEDIKIDSSGPGYSERRQLRERTTETAPVSTLNQPITLDRPDHPSTAIPNVPTSVAARVIIEDRPLLHASQSEGFVSSHRRKKNSKRRIVDLSIDESPQSKPKRPSFHGPQGPSTMITPDLSGSNASSVNALEMLGERQAAAANGDPFLAPNHQAPTRPVDTKMAMTPPHTPPVSQATVAQETVLADELENLKLSGNAEAYRKRVEAMKEQFGNSWIRMLSQSGWEQYSELAGDEHLLQPPMSSLRTSSQGIVSTGRTLG